MMWLPKDAEPDVRSILQVAMPCVAHALVSHHHTYYVVSSVTSSYILATPCVANAEKPFYGKRTHVYRGRMSKAALSYTQRYPSRTPLSHNAHIRHTLCTQKTHTTHTTRNLEAAAQTLDTRDGTYILKSQYPSTFTIKWHCGEDFSEFQTSLWCLSARAFSRATSTSSSTSAAASSTLSTTLLAAAA